MRRPSCCCLSFGTSLERIAAESLTPPPFSFVHRNISRRRFGSSTRSGLRTVTARANSLKSLRDGVESEAAKSQQDSRPLRHSLASAGRARNPSGRMHQRRNGFRARCFASPRNDSAQPHCVFATLGGVADVTNDVASSMASPNGVGILTRNGIRMRVPAIGTKAISMLRASARYLITGRSGM